MRFEGKVALIAGGSGDIGSAVCRRFVSEGASVLLTYHDRRREAESLVGELREIHGAVHAFPVDARDHASADEGVDHTLELFGKLDTLVNCIGITRDTLLLRTRDEDWAEIAETNLTATFRFSRAAAKPMVRQRWGRIVNISSVAVLAPAPGQASYAASKSGVEGLTRALAVELGPKGVTVNAVAPGRIVSRMTQELHRKEGDRLLSRIPLRRYGEPEQVASVVAFLASEDAAYVTGQVIVTDGGLSLAAKL